MKKICIIVLSFILVGCSQNISEESIVAVNSQNSYKNIELYNIYKNDKYILKKYEPEEKCYLGVFTEQTDGDFIEEYKDFTKTNPSLYMYSQRLDDSYPLSWVLNCYSNLKTPFITILPPKDEKNIFNKMLIKNVAKDFGSLQIPMFISIYPANNYFADKRQEYIKFLQDAKTYFEMYAPNVAIAWSIDKDFSYQLKDFYPGDSYVDWVGLDIYEDINENNKLDIMFKELDFFYKTYSTKKPIFLNVAISHFGSTSYNYNIDEKIKEINRYFNRIPSKYKRIKMVNYINYDTFKTDKINKQNYLVTDNKKILEAYTKALNNENFLDTVIFADNKREIIQEYKLNILAYKIDNKFFVDKSYFDLNKIQLNDLYLKDSININGKDYYKIENILKENNMKMNIDEENKKILLLK
ncbi:glycosyl hydrolase [uncultured Tyzzerella sp.]|uniref:glycosyl hydrolase n=1 Tax=uncultured Tyzzerella sp. TaxID=2321398 RepID=UPI0029422EE8|nr:glycosyl hydrolase [uncultured Tyzzerella sp.]